MKAWIVLVFLVLAVSCVVIGLFYLFLSEYLCVAASVFGAVSCLYAAGEEVIQ